MVDANYSWETNALNALSLRHLSSGSHCCPQGGDRHAVSVLVSLRTLVLVRCGEYGWRQCDMHG
jgi:hypothetical protein